MNFPMLAVKNAKREDFKDQKRKTARFQRSKTQNGTLSGGGVSTSLERKKVVNCPAQKFKTQLEMLRCA